MPKINYEEYKIGLIALKYIPILMFVIMLMHTGFLIFGLNGPCADTIAGSAVIPSILILAISNMFKFCYLHKLLTLYSLSIDLCMNFQRYIGFGIYLHFVRYIMFIFGIIILCILIFKFNKYKTNCCVIR